MLIRRLHIQTLTGLKIDIKTTIEAVGWSWDIILVILVTILVCKVCYLPKEGATTQIQPITTVLECQPRIARCSDFYVNSPNFKHLQVITKKKKKTNPICISLPQPKKREKIAHVHRPVVAYGYQSGIYVLVITSLWCKPSYSPNLNQTVTVEIDFRY